MSMRLRTISKIGFCLLTVILLFSQAEGAPEKLVLTTADGYQIHETLTN